jgi:hypothetical protein
MEDSRGEAVAGLPPRRAQAAARKLARRPQLPWVTGPTPTYQAAEHVRARRRARRLGEAGRAQAQRAEHGTVLSIHHIFSWNYERVVI